VPGGNHCATGLAVRIDVRRLPLHRVHKWLRRM